MSDKKKVNVFDIVDNKETKNKNTSKESRKTNKIADTITVLAETDSENYEKVVKSLTS